MAIEVFNRYEHKYILNQQQYDEMIKVMNEHMNPDPYNKGGKPYTITNIYYDTQDDHLIRASLSKPIYKEKLRLRSYGVPKDGQKVFLHRQRGEHPALNGVVFEHLGIGNIVFVAMFPIALDDNAEHIEDGILMADE